MSPQGFGRSPRRRAVGVLVLTACLAACGRGPATSDAVVVFAAASLTDAVGEIVARVGAATATPIHTSFAASSTLAAQIVAGAPADVFLSADTRWMDDLAARGLIERASRVDPITNRLVVIAPHDAPPLRIDPSAPGAIARALGRDGRLAIGDPEHVPAGRYARRALERLGVWPDLEPRLARTFDVRAALALVARGEAPLGIVYATDAGISADVRVVATLPSESDAPVRYAFAILAGRDTPASRTIFDWITGPEGIAIFERHGFGRS